MQKKQKVYKPQEDGINYLVENASNESKQVNILDYAMPGISIDLVNHKKPIHTTGISMMFEKLNGKNIYIDANNPMPSRHINWIDIYENLNYNFNGKNINGFPLTYIIPTKFSYEDDVYLQNFLSCFMDCDFFELKDVLFDMPANSIIYFSIWIK